MKESHHVITFATDEEAQAWDEAGCPLGDLLGYLAPVASVVA